MKRNLEADEKRVLEWFHKYANGYKKAFKRSEILKFLMPQIGDRYFREIASSLKHKGEIASTSTRGYWRVPLCTTDRNEINAALESIAEMRKKALDMLKGCGELEKKFNGMTQGQQEMAL